MACCVGVRREDRSEWERRVPVTPGAASELREQAGVQVYVQPSAIRAFADGEFERAGAIVQEDLDLCSIVLAIKEIPAQFFRRAQAYMFFAHVIKGQPHNMPMLRRLMDLECTLIDYEKVVDDQGRRLIFFGWHAGVAGAVETLWALGRRLEVQGIVTPFLQLRHAYEYRDLAEVKEAVRRVGAEIQGHGLPAALVPLAVGVTGYGNVARGVWEILDLLPVQRIEPDRLETLAMLAAPDSRGLYAVTFREEHLAARKAAGTLFALQHYYAHPEEYEGVFERYAPHLTVLINAIYWDPRYPRLITKAYLRELFSAGMPRLRVIGDISCDIEGSIECTVRDTEPGDPVFVYEPFSGEAKLGVEGDGMALMAVGILPSELPRDASEDFSRVLRAYIPALAAADYSLPLEALDLPPEIKRAIIVLRGRLTPDFRYLEKYLEVEG